jgi:four helix bundle protein
MLHRPSPQAQAPTVAAILDCERLDAYAAALTFQTLAARLSRGLSGPLRDQLDRASLSTLLNLAEGVGRIGPGEKARFYAISRGSASECAALVDVLRARGLAEPSLCTEARTLLVRIVQMTTGLEQAMRRRQQRLTAAERRAG